MIIHILYIANNHLIKVNLLVKVCIMYFPVKTIANMTNLNPIVEAYPVLVMIEGNA